MKCLLTKIMISLNLTLTLRPFFSALSLEALGGGSLLLTNKFPEIPDTNFLDLGRMKA